ncbi:MAG: NAD(P)/FAD-dependent oxidoreductase [Acidobacteria bacterium]|nr:NAD(P)/FAD-dependent oxidoreductase [Acidobacteriota bacterium]
MNLPHVVIIGGGFGGLTAARALRRLPVRVTLIDRANHHLFQPLLYQVATAMLMPGQIAAPIRQVLQRHRRAQVVLGDVTGVEAGRRQVIYHAGESGQQRLDYDYLIVATGVRHSYFGRGDFEPFAPGLKTLGDATHVRNRILSAFEAAERETDVAKRRALLTFVVVGGGPTGVELAGAIAELARVAMKEDFRRIDTRLTRILLVEAGPRILPSFSEDLAAAATGRLRAMGVDVACGSAVEEIDDGGVRVGGVAVAGRTVLWAAGVEGSPAAAWLGAPRDRAGRVQVRYDLSVPDRPEIFVIGDVAAFEQDGRQLPGVAQVALQMGRHAARVIEARLLNDAPPPPFSYRDTGNLAVVGRNYAVLERGRLRLSGYPAWAVWSMIHILFLALPNMRASVFLQWVWSYVTGQLGSRLIVEQKFSSSSGRSSRSGG